MRWCIFGVIYIVCIVMCMDGDLCGMCCFKKCGNERILYEYVFIFRLEIFKSIIGIGYS